MPKETFGGDDDSGAAKAEETKRKLDLSRFSKGQDMNNRYGFGEIVEAYADNQQPESLSSLENDRLALVRAAVGAVSRPSPLHARLTPANISKYTIMMLLDAGWQDALAEFLEECDHRNEMRKAAAVGIRKLVEDANYGQKITDSMRQMLRNRDSSESALRYVLEADSPVLAKNLGKELIIFARGDIGENQLNAIGALAMLEADEESVKVMMLLLTHWDEGARRAAAEVLLKLGKSEAADAAKKRLASETDPEARALLEKLAKLKK